MRMEYATGAGQAEREKHRARHDRGKSRCGSQSEGRQALASHIPERKKQEQREQNPFQISSTDDLLDPVTTRGIHITNRGEKVVIIADWLGCGQKRKHMLLPVYFIDQTAETVKTS